MSSTMRAEFRVSVALNFRFTGTFDVPSDPKENLPDSGAGAGPYLTWGFSRAVFPHLHR
jgi:hypothetical protein